MRVRSEETEADTRSQSAPDPTALIRPRLTAVWDGGFTTAPLPESGSLTLGRSQTCDLRISAGSVSREHARIHGGPRPSIEDLGSSNGTRVDGRRLEENERAPLYPGRVVELGDALIVLQQGQHLGLPGTEPLPIEVPGRASTPSSQKGAMEHLYRLVDLVATGTLSVILQGETGVGKEVMAQRIHQRSARAQGPFLKINCAAFAESMVESELFGYERGAFTGAGRAKPGLLEAARGGTVLLDEVTELSLAMQAKLLRALGSSEILRIGALKPTPIDVRFVAATNQDFNQLISEGRFRADLYFRLNGITLYIPRLRDRVSEIIPLAEQFASAEGERCGLSQVRFSDRALSWMLGYDWPGNIRELKNVIERAVLLSRGAVIDVEHLVPEQAALPPDWAAPEARSRPRTAPPSAPASRDTRADDRRTTPVAFESGQPTQLRNELERLERERIVEAIDRCAGNQTRAAKLLGISRRALLHRLDAYGLPRPRKPTVKDDVEDES